MTRHLACLAVLVASSTLATAEIIYVSDISGHVCTFDTSTMTASMLGSLPAQGYSINQIIGVTHDSVRDKLLLLARHDFDVYTMDPVTGTAVVLFNPPNTFQGGAVLGDILYGIDENTQSMSAYSLTTFAAQPVSGIGFTEHCHGMGVDLMGMQLYLGCSGAIREIATTGTPGVMLFPSSNGSEDIEYWNGDFIGVNCGNEVTLTDGVTGTSTVLITAGQLTGAGLTTCITGVGLRQLGAPIQVRTVDAPAAAVGPGSMGAVVTVDVENTGMAAVDVTAVTLAFRDAGMAVVTGQYTVTPDPGNPTSIAVGATETFTFSVAVAAMPTLGAITIDAGFTGIEQGTMAAVADPNADTTDSWMVIGAVPFVRSVVAPATMVGQGSSGHAVTVAIENTGLDPMLVTAVGISFTGTADRTSEYTVMASPTNPTVIGAGTTETFDYSVSVSPSATTELVTLDASVAGLDTVTGAAVSDIGADVTDSWTVVTCAATMCGDCNRDLVITILDALVAAQHAAALITLVGVDFTNCNVLGAIEPDPAAVVSILDALTLAQFAAGLPVMLVCC